MNAQGHIIVPLERKGEAGKDAVSIQPSTDNLVYAEGDRIKAINIFAYRGNERITLTDDNWGGMSSISGLSSGVQASGGIITLDLTRNDLTANINGTVTYSIIIDGTTYEKTCYVECVFDGADGEPGEKGDPGPQGDPGEDAIYYELELSCETLEYNAFADAFAPSTITIRVVRVKGEEREYVAFSGRISGRVSTNISNVTSYECLPSSFLKSRTTSGTEWGTELTISVYPVENSAVQLTHTIYPTCSYFPRVRYWDDVAEGGQFCQGKLGEQYRDIVIYPKPKDTQTPSYFYCRTSHTKSDSAIPVGDYNDQYWQGMSYYESIATGLLLADLAKINNLYVDDVFMVRENTAIWIDPLNEGMKINSTSKLTGGTDINDQNAEDWANPTTWFHGASVPSASQIYGSTTVTTNSQTISARQMYHNEAENAVRVDSSICATTGTIVADLPVGRTLVIRNTTAIEKAFRMVEGEYTTTTFGLTQSSAQIWLYKVVDGVQSKLIQLSVIYGAGQDHEEEETYLSCPTFSLSHTNVGSSTQQVQVALGFESGQFMAGAELYLDEPITITPSVSMLTEGYVSQFGADGIFLGYDSYNYLMHKLSEALTQHTLLANNIGVDLTQNGAMQVVGGYSLPLGGWLFMGNLVVSGTSVTGYFRTFNGASLTITRESAGRYLISLPSSWATLFGSSTSEENNHFVPMATLAEQSTGNMVAYASVVTNSGYWKRVIIVTKLGDTDTDPNNPIHVRLDYMGLSGISTVSLGATEAEIIDD